MHVHRRKKKYRFSNRSYFFSESFPQKRITLYDWGNKVHNKTLASDEKDNITSTDFRVQKQFPEQQLYYQISGYILRPSKV